MISTALYKFVTILGMVQPASVFALQIPPSSQVPIAVPGFACSTLVIEKLPVWQKLAKLSETVGCGSRCKKDGMTEDCVMWAAPPPPKTKSKTCFERTAQTLA